MEEGRELQESLIEEKHSKRNIASTKVPSSGQGRAGGTRQTRREAMSEPELVTMAIFSFNTF